MTLERRQKQTIPKTVNGTPVSQQEFLDAIAGFVREREFAKPRQIADDLGPEWANDAARLRHVAQTMNNMRNSGKFVRDERGIYSLAPNYDRKRGRTLENSIIETLRSLGGLARASEILDEFDARPAAHKESPNAGRSRKPARRIYQTLAASHKIKRYVGVKTNNPNVAQVMWGLPWHEMLAEPLTGRNADFLMKLAYLQMTEKTGKGGRVEEARLYATIKDHYDTVGLTFRRLRETYDEDIYVAAADPAVAEHLERIKLTKSTITNRVFAEIRAMAERRAANEGKRGDVRLIERYRDEEAERVLAHFLAFFENGDPAMHVVCPADFYRAYADRYGVCPASLSRGTIIRCVQPTVIEDGWVDGDEAAAEIIQMERPVPEEVADADTPVRSTRA